MSEADATGDDETAGAGGEAAPDDLRRQLTQAVTERNQLAQLLKHEAESARLVIEARNAAEGRIAELEGIVTGSEAVRARAEAEREEFERRLTAELAASEQHHGELLGDSGHRVEALAELLNKQAVEADDERAENDRRREADAERIADLDQRLADLQASAEADVVRRQAEAKAARANIKLKPRAARKLGEAQAELDAERSAREELQARVASLTDAREKGEQARAAERATPNERVAELEPALEEARSGWEQSWKELGTLSKLLEESDTAREQLQDERDTAQQRVAEITRSLAEADDAIAVLERALESVSAERDRIETARRVLEARLSTRDEAERVLLAEREAERRTAHAHRLQLTRVERRLMEVAGGISVAVRRLEAPSGAPPEGAAEAARVSPP